MLRAGGALLAVSAWSRMWPNGYGSESLGCEAVIFPLAGDFGQV